MKLVNLSNYVSELYRNYSIYYNNLKNNHQYNFYITKNGEIKRMTDLLDKVFKDPYYVVLKSKFNLFYKYLNEESDAINKLNPRMKNIYNELTKKRNELTKLDYYYNTETIFEMCMMDVIDEFSKKKGKPKFFKNIDSYFLEYDNEESFLMKDFQKYPTIFEEFKTTNRPSKYKFEYESSFGKIYSKK